MRRGRLDSPAISATEGTLIFPMLYFIISHGLWYASLNESVVIYYFSEESFDRGGVVPSTQAGASVTI